MNVRGRLVWRESEFHQDRIYLIAGCGKSQIWAKFASRRKSTDIKDYIERCQWGKQIDLSSLPHLPPGLHYCQNSSCRYSHPLRSEERSQWMSLMSFHQHNPRGGIPRGSFNMRLAVLSDVDTDAMVGCRHVGKCSGARCTGKGKRRESPQQPPIPTTLSADPIRLRSARSSISYAITSKMATNGRSTCSFCRRRLRVVLSPGGPIKFKGPSETPYYGAQVTESCFSYAALQTRI